MRNAALVCVGMLLVLGFAGSMSGQAFEPAKFAQAKTDWQLSAISGFFTGGKVWEGTIDGVDGLSVEADDGVVAGLRFGADQEYLGWELTFAGVFADLEVNDDLADLVDSSGDATWLLGSVNALWYPGGNEFADGRIRPFLTAGPGFAHFMSDLSEADSETMFDANVGLGIKFLLGEQGNPVLRVDYRWHFITGGGSGWEDKIYRQELTAGLGISF